MTPAEFNAITVLGERLNDFRDDNKASHQELKYFIKSVEDRLTRKICEKDAARDAATKQLISHCQERELEVNASIAKVVVATDAHIAAAKVEAVAEAKPKPSIYKQATQGALEGLLRFAAKATVLVILAGGCLTLLDKLHLL